MTSESTIKKLRAVLMAAHLRGEVVTKRELSANFTARDIKDAETEGVIIVDSTTSEPTVRSSEIETSLYGRVSAAASVPRASPIQSSDGRLWFWRLDGKVQPFGVLQTDRGFRLVLTRGGKEPTVQTSTCWQVEVEYGRDELQHALVDAHDANLGYAEGLYLTTGPWRHPATDRPISLRKP